MNKERLIIPSRISEQLKKNIPILTIVFLGILVLLFAFNPHLPYEQDQVGKAAQILHLIDTSNEWQPLQASNIYRNFELSNYYLIAANLYKLIGGDIFTFMNWQSIIWGIIFFLSIARLINIVFKTPLILTFVVFINMPIIVTTFIYGNEVAVSLSLFILSLLLSQLSFKGHEYLSPLLLCLALYARIDVVLLLPFWFAWNMYYSCQGVSAKGKILFISKQFILFVAYCLTYWLLFIREVPLNKYSFAYNTNIKLLLGFVTYPFNFSVVLWGAYSLAILLFRNFKEGVIYLLLLVPFFFYLPNLSTPKYIISFSLMLGIPLAINLAKMSWQMKSLVLLTLSLWWFVSITPFGFFSTKEGAYWYLPTADGPIPTGAYLNFYSNVRKGLYQERYVAEFNGAEMLFDFLEEQSSPHQILGYFNLQFYDYEMVKRKLWNTEHQFEDFPWSRFNVQSDENGLFIMMDRSYLNLGSLELHSQEIVREWLRKGQIEILDESDGPFPKILMIGDALNEGSEVELGKRILFMDSYYNGQRVLPSSQFIPAYKSLCWIPRSISEHNGYETNVVPIYQDAAFIAVEQDAKECSIYNTFMPYVYFNEEDPRGY